jgi:hypothetical protein
MKIISNLGTEELRFGFELKDCISILGNEYKIKPKVISSVDEYIFPQKGVFLSFNNQKLEYIGFLKNADVEFNGINFLKMKLEEIKAFLICKGDCLEDENSLISKRNGLSFYFSNKTDTAFPDEISVFKDGYYDEMEDDFKKL